MEYKKAYTKLSYVVSSCPLATFAICHHSPKAFSIDICRLCEVMYTKKHNFNSHICDVHTHTYLYQCETCGNEFITNSLLKKHLRYEHGPFQTHAQLFSFLF